MATIIDSLVVKLGMDGSGFSAGKSKVDKGLKDTAKEAKATGASFNDLAKSAAGFLAVIGGTAAVKHFIEDTITSSAALDRLSLNLKRNAGEIASWSNSVELMGGTAQGLQGTMDMLSKSQTELMLTGQSSLIPFFSALGVSLADLNGNARPANDIFLSLADRFAGMDRTTANNMGRSMGIDQGTMNLLLAGRKEVELMLKRQKEYGDVMNKLAPQSTKINRMFLEGKQSVQLFSLELFAQFIPALEKLYGVFEGIGVWVKDNKEFVGDFLIVLAGGLGLVGAALVPINLTAAALVGLGAAIAAVWQDYQVWQRGGDSFLPWEKWMPSILKATAALETLRQKAIEATVSFYEWAAKKSKESGAQFDRMEAREEALSGKSPSASTGDPLSFFQSKGWSASQAAGIVANLQSESAMNPNAVGDSGKAFGIAQWHPDRQANFKAWLGRDIKGSSLSDQLEFVHYELTQGSEQGAGKALRGAGSASDAGGIVSRMYERPADAAGEASRRAALATTMMGVPGAAGNAAGAGGGALASAGMGNRSSVTNIRDILVTSNATNAQGLVDDIQKSKDYLFVSQSNYGMM